MVTEDGITRDVVVCFFEKANTSRFSWNGKQYEVYQLDRFTLRVKYDTIDRTPYLLVAYNRLSLLLNTTLAQ